MTSKEEAQFGYKLVHQRVARSLSKGRIQQREAATPQILPHIK
jgi:hypothetical protein